VRTFLLIFLSLVLALAGWSTAGADDFYVIPVMRGNYAPVPKTGQTTPYGTRDDGALKQGVAWPTLRFTDNNNGTVTDNLTGLIWLRDANYYGTQNWANALSIANDLESDKAGLTDGSKKGDWRLPNIRELQSLVDYARSYPALPDNHHFQNVQLFFYWSSTTNVDSTDFAWFVDFRDGFTDYLTDGLKTNLYSVWCVRGGR
jgi:hypothetical protein